MPGGNPARHEPARVAGEVRRVSVQHRRPGRSLVEYVASAVTIDAHADIEPVLRRPLVGKAERDSQGRRTPPERSPP